MCGIVAQLEERLLHTQEVIGSRPVGPITTYRQSGQPRNELLNRLLNKWALLGVPVLSRTGDGKDIDRQNRGD